MVELREKMRETTLFLEEANTKYEEVISKFTQHEKERKEVIAKNKILKSAVQILEEHVKTLQNACNDMEQYSKRECLEIQGIPVNTNVHTNLYYALIYPFLIYGLIICLGQYLPNYSPSSFCLTGKSYTPHYIFKI